MNPRLTRGEYWLLNIVATHWVPVPWLATSRPDLAWNRVRDHGLNRASLVETLVSMFERGWIEAERINRGRSADDEDAGEPVVLNRKNIQEILDQGEELRRDGVQFYYGLTADGGAVWEAFSLPMWERYLDAYSGCPAEFDEADHRSICGASMSRIEMLLRLFEQEGEIIDRESIQWDVLTPWKATYWKTLPSGYRLTYQFEDSTRDYTDLAKRNAMYERCHLERWYDWD